MRLVSSPRDKDLIRAEALAGFVPFSMVGTCSADGLRLLVTYAFEGSNGLKGAESVCACEEL